MVNLVETLFGIAIVSGVICVLAFIQSKSPGEGSLKYRRRLRMSCTIGLVALGLGVIGEVLLRLNDP
jgi:hypothetical protein